VGRHVDGPRASGRLGRAVERLARQQLDRTPSHRHRSGRKVDVLPVQAQHLASTQPTPRRQQHRRPVPRCDRLHEGNDLGYRGHSPLLRTVGAGARNLAGVLGEIPSRTAVFRTARMNRYDWAIEVRPPLPRIASAYQVRTMYGVSWPSCTPSGGARCSRRLRRHVSRYLGPSPSSPTCWPSGARGRPLEHASAH
jgi:hypothetical protein